MPWYRAGSVAVTNGSATVIGAGTDFVGNAQAGEVFLGPDGRVYEISAVQSATQLTIIPNYQGASAGGQAYGIQPTASFARDLALGAAQLLNTFGGVRDGIGQGLVPDGSAAAPGIRFAADQDTGLRRPGANELSIVTGGTDRVSFNQDGAVVSGSVAMRQPNGNVHSIGTDANDLIFRSVTAGAETMRVTYSGHVGIGTATPAAFGGYTCLTLGGSGHGYLRLGSPGNAQSLIIQNNFGGAAPALATGTAHPLILGTDSAERMRIDVSGNLLVGVSSGSYHKIQKASVGENGVVFGVAGATDALVVYGAQAYNWNGAATAMTVARNSVTGRSINGAGTGNFTGSDYAEYMVKCATCGLIAKGDVVGVDRDGRLTKTWADAISFVIKSTDPSLVGGDTWAAHLPPKPEQPGAEPIEPAAPLPPAEDADEAALAAWRDAVAAHPAQLASYRAEHAAWQQADATYAAELAAWEDELESARQCVDRIAFCGQVPCNVTGDFDVGDYIIAAANGAGIKAIAVKPDAITLPQYMRRIGKVWAIRDGRAWIDVQHG
jgi:hypothetical protein